MHGPRVCVAPFPILVSCRSSDIRRVLCCRNRLTDECLVRNYREIPADGYSCVVSLYQSRLAKASKTHTCVFGECTATVANTAQHDVHKLIGEKLAPASLHDPSDRDLRLHGLPGSSELMRGFLSMILKIFCTAALALEMSGKAALALAMPNASRKIEKKTCERKNDLLL